jgi:cytochrome b561
MSKAADVLREPDDPSIGPEATVIEFVKPRLLPALLPTSFIVPAYTLTARVLHWVTALLIAPMIPLGIITANDWGGLLQDPLSSLHELLGAMLIPVVLGRLVYRLMNPPLPLPNEIAALQRFAAHATHLGLYALMTAQPLIGLIAASAAGAPAIALGSFVLPPVAPENPAFAEKLFVLHDLVGVSIAGLVAAHIGAALYHHFVRKDRVLMRMIAG